MIQRNAAATVERCTLTQDVSVPDSNVLLTDCRIQRLSTASAAVLLAGVHSPSELVSVKIPIPNLPGSRVLPIA